MIIEYLDIEQSLKYLKKKTGDKYTFDNLKELNYAGKLDVFFYKSCLIYDTYRSDQSPPAIQVLGMWGSPFPYHIAVNVKQARGIFTLKELLLNIESKGSKLKSKVIVEKIYEQHELIFDDVYDEFNYEQGNTVYLSHADFSDLQYLSDGSINSAPLRNKAVDSIEQDELRFKKQQFDNLINNSNNSIEKLNEGFNDDLPTDSVEHIKQLEQLLADSELKIVQLEGQLKEKLADDLKKVPHQSHRTIVRIMYAMAELTELDNSNPYSQNLRSLNTEITTILENDGFPLGYEAVGKWLTRINEL